MRLTLRIWRQKNGNAAGQFAEYQKDGVIPEMSFLEMLDALNDELTQQGAEPVAFDHDCREGICGMCSLVINGEAHGPLDACTTCQLHMREFRDGQTITIEPWRARAFPVIRDLMVDRGALDRIMQAGGYVGVTTGSAPDGNAIPAPAGDAEKAMDAAQCIGCGACVAACQNASAMLFVAAKVSHLSRLPQGQVERSRRVVNMVARMDEEGFGNCTNTGSCAAVCPKEISLENIARMNREYLVAQLRGGEE
ncbi:MAG: succinate dehydrogenase/fumarate reductase iron-sulfur subunit [Blastocatellia bacterium]